MDKHFTFEKHILIAGKTEKERYSSLNQILENNNLELIRFPKSMRSLSDYINVVQAKKLFTPFYETRGKYNANQILDFHMDWIAENNCLFIFEEFQFVDDKFRLEILRIMINNLETNHQGTKLIVTLENEMSLIKCLGEIVDETEYKTKVQVVQSNIQISTL